MKTFLSRSWALIGIVLLSVAMLVTVFITDSLTVVVYFILAIFVLTLVQYRTDIREYRVLMADANETLRRAKVDVDRSSLKIDELTMELWKYRVYTSSLESELHDITTDLDRLESEMYKEES